MKNKIIEYILSFIVLFFKKEKKKPVNNIKNKIKPVYDFVPKWTVKEESLKIEDPELLFTEKEVEGEDIETESEVTATYTSELIDFINGFNFKRSISTLFYHCTATPQSASVSSIENYWYNGLKWKSPGYHIIVKPSGEWTLLQDFNRPSNGVLNHNANSLHISYIGGIDAKGNALNNMTENQKRVFISATKAFGNKIKDLKVKGHNEVSKKDCPSFDVKKFLKLEGLETFI